MTSNSSSLGRLDAYHIEGLWGRRTIHFSPVRPGPTLLTGANGSGKSTVLRTVHAVGSGLWLDLLATSFETLELHFDTGEWIRVSRVPERSDEALLVALSGYEPWLLDRRELDFPDTDELGAYRGVRRLPNGWEMEGRIYSASELRELLAIRDAAALDEAEWVADIPSRFPVLYIPDQRLFTRGPQATRRGSLPTRLGTRAAGTAEQYSRDLGRQIADGLSRYAAQSQTLDREFPQKVVEAMARSVDVTRDELTALLDRVDAEREDLESAGLLQREEHSVHFESESLPDPQILPVIKVYAEDTLAKFSVLAELKEQLKTFAGFLNAHYTGKRIEIRQRGGFLIAVVDKDEDEHEHLVDVLSPSHLSSGEQQVLVLAYQILFMTEPRTLILIDEPELSLHVLWQSTLIEDLTRMGSVRDVDFLVATHSPTLVGSREDLRISLDGSGDNPSELAEPVR